GGEPVRLTASASAIQGYAWSPDGRQIAFTATDADDARRKARLDAYGAFEVVRRDYAHVHLYTIDVATALAAPQPGRRRTSGTRFSVQGFDWHPDGRRIAFAATVNPDLVNGTTADLYVVQLASDDGRDSVTTLVSQPGPEGSPVWSPDGRQLAFTTFDGKTSYFALNNRIAVVDAAGGTPRVLTGTFDETVSPIAWTPAGLYFSASQRTAQHLFRLEPATGRITRVSQPDAAVVSGVSPSADGRTVAMVQASASALPEVMVSSTERWAPTAITQMSAQLTGLVMGRREVIQWRSRDGELIEGVLISPAGYDGRTRLPLLCVIHGGPTGVDRPVLPDARYYPIDLWVARGALVLKVNYRGSAAYGERFRRLNVRNLGVGDAWDVLSGVDHLVQKGWADPAKVASMGWSQGGYISAFLTTSTTRFAAISVGAGISNWATYYYNTDITPFTINYLGDDPADDPAIYAKTSPMSYVKQAKTPTLIQHGELDRRVPIANAYELRQGLEDRGVPVELVVYKGYGHGITRPKSQRAVMAHNLGWFNHYLWGDPKPDFTAPPASP
nr:S9 family peptidase [Gemmatimonadaceae bacterium]